MSEIPELRLEVATSSSESPEPDDRFDFGTMEHPLDGGTLVGSQPRGAEPELGPSEPKGPLVWISWLAPPALAIAVVVVGGLTAFSPRQVHLPAVQVVQVEILTELGTLRAELAANPEGPNDLDLRARYAALLTQAGMHPDAFEEHLTIVRRSPTSASGREALLQSIAVAETLAMQERVPGLWTERWVATLDRFARYWPGEPITPVLLEDAVASLSARGRVREAELLVSEHLSL